MVRFITLLSFLSVFFPRPGFSQTFSEDGFEFRTDDKNFELEIGGRLMLDAGFFDEDDEDGLDDGTVVPRRARLETSVVLFSDWKLRATYEFSSGKPEILDGWLGYSGIDNLEIRAGRFKEQFSLEEQTSSNYITFMERGLPNVFSPGYNAGVGVFSGGDSWTASGGLFGGRAGEAFERRGDERGVTGRVTYAPWDEERRIAHLGLSFTHRRPEDREVRFRRDPESAPAEINLVSSGTLRDVADYDSAALEAATVFGPLSVQGEYFHTAVNRDNGRVDLNFDGWYVFASWFLTGEHRPYGKGEFRRVKPQGKWGAWELALRVSELDLNDGPVTGGRELNTTLGLNWYVRRNLRFMSNLIHVDTDGEAGDRDFNILQFRAQLYF